MDEGSVTFFNSKGEPSAALDNSKDGGGLLLYGGDGNMVLMRPSDFSMND
jgi:hypothetical protein